MEFRDEAATRKQRYEAIFRAVIRRLRPSTIGCTAATVVTALVWAWVGLPAVLGATTLFDPFAALVFWLAGFAALVLIIPSAVQYALLSPDDRALVEGYNAYAILDFEHAPTRPRFPRWTQRNSTAALRWFESHQAFPPHRVRALLWAGKLEEAEVLIESLPQDYPNQRFQRAVAQALLEFVRDGDSSLEDARHQLSAIAEGPERTYSDLVLAFEEARLTLERGGEWREPLIRARRQIAALPRGASFRDRVRAGIPVVAGLVVGGAVLGAVISLGLDAVR